jgi:hypothetical protein
LQAGADHVNLEVVNKFLRKPVGFTLLDIFQGKAET